jgi:hypothetical protein
MSSPIETALQTILAADYGLSEGDHLRLCDILKKTFDESKKTGKVIKGSNVNDINISIEFSNWAPVRKYYLDTETWIHYVQNVPGGPGWVCPDHIVRGRCEIAGQPTRHLQFPWNAANAIMKILKLHNDYDAIKINRLGIECVYNYAEFIKDAVTADLIVKRAMKKYGSETDPEHLIDEDLFRGNYTYHRYSYFIAHMALQQ